jgi:ribonuclease P protein component
MGDESLREGETKGESGLPSNASPLFQNVLRPPLLTKLTEKKDRKELLLQGRKSVSEIMVLYFQENHLHQSRYAIYTSKRLGGAVTRNRIKRLFREVLYRKKKSLRGYDFVIVPRSGVHAMDGQTASAQIEKIFVEFGIIRG